MAVQHVNLCDYCRMRLDDAAGASATAHGLLRYGVGRNLLTYGGGDGQMELNPLLLNDHNSGRGLAILFAQDLCRACVCKVLAQIRDAAERELARLIQPDMERVAQTRAIRISDDGELGHNV